MICPNRKVAALLAVIAVAFAGCSSLVNPWRPNNSGVLGNSGEVRDIVSVISDPTFQSRLPGIVVETRQNGPSIYRDGNTMIMAPGTGYSIRLRRGGSILATVAGSAEQVANLASQLLSNDAFTETDFQRLSLHSYRPAQLYAISRLEDQEFLERRLSTGREELEIRVALVARLKSETLLATLAKNDPAEAVRVAAVRNLSLKSPILLQEIDELVREQIKKNPFRDGTSGMDREEFKKAPFVYRVGEAETAVMERQVAGAAASSDFSHRLAGDATKSISGTMWMLKQTIKGGEGTQFVRCVFAGNGRVLFGYGSKELREHYYSITRWEQNGNTVRIWDESSDGSRYRYGWDLTGNVIPNKGILVLSGINNVMSGNFVKVLAKSPKRQEVEVIGIIWDFDSDRDGVRDLQDECPDTPFGSIVDRKGCSIDQLVPCHGPRDGLSWRNHDEYVKKVTEATREFFILDLLTNEQSREIINRAKQSECGNQGR